MIKCMVSTEKFYSTLVKNKINFITGVPDSCLKNFLNYVHNKKITQISAPNEGCAVSVGIGYHLKSKKIPLFTCKIQIRKCYRSTNFTMC